MVGWKCIEYFEQFFLVEPPTISMNISGVIISVTDPFISEEPLMLTFTEGWYSSGHYIAQHTRHCACSHQLKERRQKQSGFTLGRPTTNCNLHFEVL